MPAPSRDYYEILGASQTATSGEIRQAFRQLARKHHPNIAQHDATVHAANSHMRQV